MIRKLAKIETNQREMLHLLNAIAGSAAPLSSGNDKEYFASLPEFPLSSQAQVIAFNQYLETDADFQRAVKCLDIFIYTTVNVFS